MRKQNIVVSLLGLVSPMFASADISKTAIPQELNAWQAWHHKAIKDSFAYTLGARGKGVIVAVMDSGVNSKNPEFTGRILPGFNFIAMNTNVADDNGHGTHVTGLIGASADNKGVVGVAPDVLLLPIKIIDQNRNGTSASLSAGLGYFAKSGAFIGNLSIGSAVPVSVDAIKTAVVSGKLLVVAAGNYSAANPVWPARFASELWANGQIIAVGAVGVDLKLASYSNAAGVTRDFYVVAPGTAIYSTCATTTCTMSGTSMAAPIVSGVAADIKSRWMYLSAKQVASIIFRTANRLGKGTATVSDPIYGWGLVNATAALAPVGNPVVATYKGNYYSLGPSALVANAVIPATKFAGLLVTAVDEFGRDYGYASSQFVSTKTSNPVLDSFKMIDRQMHMVTRQIGTQLRASYSEPSEINPRQGFSLSARTSFGEVSVGAGGHQGQFFGNTSGYQSVSAFVNPYMGLIGGAQGHMGVSIDVGPSAQLRAGAITTHGSNMAMNLVDDTERRVGSGMVSEYVIRKGNHDLSLMLGAMHESGHYLGLAGTDAFAINAGSTTFGLLSYGYRVSERSVLIAQYGGGSSTTSGNSLITGANARTTNWSLGIASNNVLRDGDALIAAVSQPMHVTSGRMQYSTGKMSEEGLMSFQETSINLHTEKTETRYELGYKSDHADQASVMLNIAYKINANNQQGSDSVFALRFMKKF